MRSQQIMPMILLASSPGREKRSCLFRKQKEKIMIVQKIKAKVMLVQKRKRKDYTFRRQYNEKLSTISGCPGIMLVHTSIAFPQ